MSCSLMECLQFKGDLVEYKFNMEDVNTVFRKFNFWHYHELLVVGGHRKYTGGHLWCCQLSFTVHGLLLLKFIMPVKV